MIQASLGILHLLSVLNEKALKAGEYARCVQIMEKENESVLKGWQSFQRQHEELSADKEFWKKRAHEL